MLKRRDSGYTLIEIVVALVVFTTGALGLAAGSAIVAREMSTNAVRAEAARLATSRHEIVESACRAAQSGSETRGPVTSTWTVSRPDSSRVRLAGTVSYPVARGTRSDRYSASIGCR